MGESSEHHAALEAAEDTKRRYAHAVGARYDDERGKLVIALSNGHELALNPAEVQGLEGADPESLRSIEITPSGFGVHFPDLDADLYVPGLIEGILGSKTWMARRMGAAGGRARSPEKAASSARNGRRGGRPRKRARRADPDPET
jgi:hypothetical protein